MRDKVKYKDTKKKNFKGKKFDKDAKSQESKEFSKLRESANDPNWYYYSEQSKMDVGRFSFNNALGVALPAAGGTSYTVPGIMNIYTTPAIGYSTDGSSAANIAAKNLYSFVRYANAGHTNYESADLFMYIMAMDSLYSMYAFLTRIYGAARIYIQQNRYMGAHYLGAMGMDASNVASNLATLRTYINQFAIKLSAFCVPGNMTLFKRHIWMYSNIFADEDDAKASVYMYQPATLWKFDEVNARLVPTLITCSFSSDFSPVTPGTNTVSSIIALADSMLAAVVASEDMNIMSGDILKAYGNDGIWKFSEIPDDYAILPIFSEEVLLQIHNTKFVGCVPVGSVGGSSTLDALNLYQNRTPGYGAILFTPIFANIMGGTENILFDSWKQEVTPEDVLVGSRNMVAYDTVVMQNAGGAYFPYTVDLVCGSDLCLFAAAYEINASGSMVVTKMYSSSTLPANAYTASTFAARQSRFNEAPMSVDWVSCDMSTGVVTYSPERMTGELSNYTTMTRADIQKLHDTALLSMFAVPFLGNMVKV